MNLQGPLAWVLIGALILMTILVIVFIWMWYRWKNKCKSVSGSTTNYVCDFS